jgi:hypothetical protein
MERVNRRDRQAQARRRRPHRGPGAGEGTRLFDDVPKSYRLDLVSSTELSNGTVGLHYRRVRSGRSPEVGLAVGTRAEQQPTELLPQPGGFDGFRMSQIVADANDLPRSKFKDFSDFLAELDAGHPGGQVDVTEGEDRLAEVAELLRPIGEASPRLAAVLPPNLSRAVMTSVGSCLSFKARLDRRVPLDVGRELGQKGVQIIGIPRLDGALDGLHVLVRNSRSPRRLRHGFQRNAVP